MPPRWLPIALLGLLWAADAPTWNGRAARLAPSRQDAGSLRVNNALGMLGFAAASPAAKPSIPSELFTRKEPASCRDGARRAARPFHVGASAAHSRPSNAMGSQRGGIT